MKKSVSLKGTKEGYQLIMDQSAAFNVIIDQTEELIAQLKKESNTSQEIELTVKTGNRLLTKEEKNTILVLIEEKSKFHVKAIESDVVTTKKALDWYKETSMKLEVRTVRSGQIVDVEGDVLLVGGVHPGGNVRATGSIFIIGELKGIAHAGVDGKTDAVVVADFKHDAQVRVADHVHVIEHEEEGFKESEFEVIYLNELHVLEVSEMTQLNQIRPDLGKATGGLM